MVAKWTLTDCAALSSSYRGITVSTVLADRGGGGIYRVFTGRCRPGCQETVSTEFEVLDVHRDDLLRGGCNGC